MLTGHGAAERDRRVEELLRPGRPQATLYHAFMPALPSSDIDAFLDNATSDQRAMVRALRELIAQQSFDLAERINTGKWLNGYVFYDAPDGHMVFAIGLTASGTVTLHMMPLYGSGELQDQLESAFAPFRAGKSCVRFKNPGELPVSAISRVIDAAPRYLEVVASLKAGPKRSRR